MFLGIIFLRFEEKKKDSCPEFRVEFGVT